ncbi:MAG: MOSC N-terminal beta barrel domain-containing protein, partial [Proteobacteria bacterium]|nr:MOSC N-terminal beta barrel domain-containing protein [Pseudomonadota bacterium]
MSWPVTRLCRYPVKGLSEDDLDSVSLTSDREVPGDRRFAIALPSAPFDESAPEWLPKTHFLMLARNEQLAALTVRFDPETGLLEISEAGSVRVSTDITQLSGRTEIEDFFAEYCAEALKGRPKFTEAEGHSFSDHRHKVLSFINLKSVRALGEELGVELDPIRFRGNVYFEGDAAWQEFEWTGRRLSFG